MRKAASVILSIMLIMSFIGCSKSTSESTNTSRVHNPEDAIAIDTFSTENNDETIETAPPFEVSEPTYQVKECELDIDSNNHTIVGQYVDGDDYIISFDLTYYDYGVNEVGIYNAVPTNRLGMSPINILESDWNENSDEFIGAIQTFSTDEHRKELSVQCALTYENGAVDTNSDLLDIIAIINEYNRYTVFPYYCSYQYPIAEMNDSVSNEQHIYKQHSTSEQVNFVTLRTELDGLPIGLPLDNRHPVTRCRYGDYYGSFCGVDDSYTRGFYKSDIFTQVDFLYYNYDAELIEYSKASVKPIEECILNAVPGILNGYGSNNCDVYSAELVYIPFSVGADSLGYGNYDIVYLPVWAIYMISSSPSQTPTAAVAVYLNAITGELVSRGI